MVESTLKGDDVLKNLAKKDVIVKYVKDKLLAMRINAQTVHFDGQNDKIFVTIN